MKSISVIILTLNEEKNLPFCFDSLAPLDPAIYVVDSGSIDRTVEIARAYGAHVIEHPFENHAKQLNWALENLPLQAPWCMRMDADETLSPELCYDIQEKLNTVDEHVTGFLMRRRVVFWGRWIRHGGYYPMWLLRIWRRGMARCEDHWMDEHMVIKQGTLLRLKGDLIDENHKGLSFWTEKHNRYSDREVLDLLSLDFDKSVAGLAGPARCRRWLKKNIYAKSPLFIRAFLYWAYRYFLLLGFLDGLPGLVFHFLQGFWYRFLVDAKIYELRRKESTALKKTQR